MPTDAPGRAVEAVDAAAGAAARDPLLVAVAVLVAAVLAAGAWRLIVRYRRTPGEELRAVLSEHDRVDVLMHPNPDPDAMASALAVGEIAAAVDTETTLAHPGQIRHQENRAFRTVLDLDFERVGAVAELTGEATVLVDHNEPRGLAGAESLDPVAVVDHHPGDGTGEAFTDVRPDHGACATILAEYLDDMGWKPTAPGDGVTDGGESADTGRSLPSDVATGLIYGIQSDTNHLTKGCSDAEFDATRYLYRGVDEDRLDRIANPEVDAEVLGVKARAITEREVRNAYAVSDVGTVNNADAIPQAADELLRLEGVTAVVVAGDRDGTLHLSGRSRDDRVHMGQALSAAVSIIPMADAGGHARMGGGQVSLDHMVGLGPGDGVDRRELVDRLFDAMAGDV